MINNEISEKVYVYPEDVSEQNERPRLKQTLKEESSVWLTYMIAIENLASTILIRHSGSIMFKHYLKPCGYPAILQQEYHNIYEMPILLSTISIVVITMYCVL